jgi:hypothetical protein
MEEGVYTNELGRVERGPEPHENRYDYFILPVDVECDRDAEDVLARCREVMRTVLAQPEDPWPSVEQWRQILPRWFVEAGGEEIRPEDEAREQARIAKLTFEELEKLPWPAGLWVSTFEGGRSWYWWDAEVVSPKHLSVKLAVEGHPWSEGAVRWLLIAAGAKHVVF